MFLPFKSKTNEVKTLIQFRVDWVAFLTKFKTLIPFWRNRSKFISTWVCSILVKKEMHRKFCFFPAMDAFLLFLSIFISLKEVWKLQGQQVSVNRCCNNQGSSHKIICNSKVMWNRPILGLCFTYSSTTRSLYF